MKKILLFDVDGTIAESGQKISPYTLTIIQKLKDKYDIGIVGGGKLDKILEQLSSRDNIFHHYFTECGCVYHKNDGTNLVPVYIKNLRNHKLYPKINILVKTCLSFLSTVDYLVTGYFIDLRNGIIYVSLIGMTATNEERAYFMDLDKKNNYREKLVKLLKHDCKKLGIADTVTVCEGGRVGIAIYPNEYDKIQVLDIVLADYSEIHYFGDKYKEDGNDYHIITDRRVIGHPVDSVEDTEKILLTLLN